MDMSKLPLCPDNETCRSDCPRCIYFNHVLNKTGSTRDKFVDLLTRYLNTIEKTIQEFQAIEARENKAFQHRARLLLSPVEKAPKSLASPDAVPKSLPVEAVPKSLSPIEDVSKSLEAVEVVPKSLEAVEEVPKSVAPDDPAEMSSDYCDSDDESDQDEYVEKYAPKDPNAIEMEQASVSDLPIEISNNYSDLEQLDPMVRELITM